LLFFFFAFTTIILKNRQTDLQEDQTINLVTVELGPNQSSMIDVTVQRNDLEVFSCGSHVVTEGSRAILFGAHRINFLSTFFAILL
jgi:hypothetical protein